MNTAYSATLAASGGTAPYAWTVTGLPAGLSLDSKTGAITGTPTASGTSTLAVDVTDASSPAQTQKSSLTLAISGGALAITSKTLPPGAVNVSYSATLAATGGIAPYTWTATGQPNGLTLNATTGAITGKPTTQTSTPASVTIQVQDSSSPAQTVKSTGHSAGHRQRYRDGIARSGCDH
ncbi:MAG: putative Ig domain-containing protein [Steroidobacteraceae bacterium]